MLEVILVSDYIYCGKAILEFLYLISPRDIAFLEGWKTDFLCMRLGWGWGRGRIQFLDWASLTLYNDDLMNSVLVITIEFTVFYMILLLSLFAVCCETVILSSTITCR